MPDREPAAAGMHYTLSSVSWPESVWKRDRDHLDELTLSVHADGYYGDFSIRWVELNGKAHPG